jgi:hypothetical protein
VLGSPKSGHAGLNPNTRILQTLSRRNPLTRQLIRARNSPKFRFLFQLYFCKATSFACARRFAAPRWTFPGKKRAYGGLRHTQAQDTIRQAGEGCRARGVRARGVDCCACEAGRIPSRRAFVFSSCYSGKRAERRFAPLGPSVESVGEFSSCAVQRNAPPVIRLLNRGEYPRQICGHPGRPSIFRKTCFVCGAAESSREGFRQRRLQGIRQGFQQGRKQGR